VIILSTFLILIFAYFCHLQIQGISSFTFIVICHTDTVGMLVDNTLWLLCTKKIRKSTQLKGREAAVGISSAGAVLLCWPGPYAGIHDMVTWSCHFLEPH